MLWYSFELDSQILKIIGSFWNDTKMWEKRHVCIYGRRYKFDNVLDIFLEIWYNFKAGVQVFF